MPMKMLPFYIEVMHLQIYPLANTEEINNRNLHAQVTINDYSQSSRLAIVLLTSLCSKSYGWHVS